MNLHFLIDPSAVSTLIRPAKIEINRCEADAIPFENEELFSENPKITFNIKLLALPRADYNMSNYKFHLACQLFRNDFCICNQNIHLNG